VINTADVVDDFLPPPEELVLRGETVKVTVSSRERLAGAAASVFPLCRIASGGSVALATGPLVVVEHSQRVFEYRSS
jgi:hypothetical protein